MLQFFLKFLIFTRFALFVKARRWSDRKDFSLYLGYAEKVE